MAGGNAFRALDLERVKALLRRPLVIDLRNIYQPQEMQAAGLLYHSIGRPETTPGATTPGATIPGAPSAQNPAPLRAVR